MFYLQHFSKRDFVKILLFRSFFEIARVVLSALRKIIVVAHTLHLTVLQRHPTSPTTSPWRTPRRLSSTVLGCAPQRRSGAALSKLVRRRRRRRFVSSTIVVVIVVGGGGWLSRRVVPFFFVVVDRNFDLVRGTRWLVWESWGGSGGGVINAGPLAPALYSTVPSVLSSVVDWGGHPPLSCTTTTD